MSITIPEWVEKINAYLWLSAIGVTLSAISMIYNEKYLLLWLLTFLYGVLGFANNVGLKKHPKSRFVLSIILLVIFTVAFIFLSTELIKIKQLPNNMCGARFTR
ncbi:MAG: hypothetical protein IT215_00635 [Chitinophagaceae bacterium]|nr:hypothetical protein [Chitinophagaceae bacterium]